METTFTIAEPAALIITSIDVTNALCDGDSNGSAVVNVSGGTPFTDGSYQIDGNLDNLAAGTYPVTVTDANGCTTTGEFTVTDPDELIITSIDVTNASCSGFSDGSAVVNVSGGTPFTDGSYQIDGDLDNLVAGTYSVTVTDANGCITTGEFTVNVPNPIDVTINTTDAICNGEYDDLPEAAFYMVGGIDEVIEKAKQMAAEAA